MSSCAILLVVHSCFRTFKSFDIPTSFLCFVEFFFIASFCSFLYGMGTVCINCDCQKTTLFGFGVGGKALSYIAHTIDKIIFTESNVL